MKEFKKEKILDDYPLPVTIDKTKIILNQMEKYICKIENKNGYGTGFFCYIFDKNKLLPVLITNNHVINQESIKENEILTLTINKIQKSIKLNNNRKIYTSIKYDVTIIEIIKEKDEIYNFLELDDNIFNENLNLFNKSIYILHYPRLGYNQEASVSYGILKDIQDEYNIIHYCCTLNGSSGSPILNLINNKVIGIHKESSTKFNFNKGTILNIPIKEFLNNKNIIIKKKKETNIINQNNVNKINNDDNNKKVLMIHLKDTEKNNDKELINNNTEKSKIKKVILEKDSISNILGKIPKNYLPKKNININFQKVVLNNGPKSKEEKHNIHNTKKKIIKLKILNNNNENEIKKDNSKNTLIKEKTIINRSYISKYYEKGDIKSNSYLYESIDDEDSTISISPNSVDNDRLHRIKLLLEYKNDIIK